MVKKKIVIVFGGTGLIGSALMRSMSLNKKYKLINLDLNIKKNMLINFKCNVLNEKQTENRIKQITHKYGKIYGVINATYPKVIQKKSPGKINPNLFAREISNHLKSFFNTTQIMCNYFKKKKIEGRIINLASIYGEFIPRIEIYKGTNISAPMQYLISKNSLITMTKYFSKFFLKDKININCISPGGIYDSQDHRFLKNYNKFCASGMLNAEDLIGITKFLLSDDSKKIFGQNIVIDDGFTL